MLIELLRQVTFKIKVMDYIARRAFTQEVVEDIVVSPMKSVGGESSSHSTLNVNKNRVSTSN